MNTVDFAMRNMVRYGAVIRCRYSYSTSSSEASGMTGHRCGHRSRLAMFCSRVSSQAVAAAGLSRAMNA
jgi:hypothetical protein